MTQLQEIIKIITLLQDGNILVQSISNKFWIEKNGEKVITITPSLFQRLQYEQIIQSCGVAYCRFEFELSEQFKS